MSGFAHAGSPPASLTSMTPGRSRLARKQSVFGVTLPLPKLAAPPVTVLAQKPVLTPGVKMKAVFWSKIEDAVVPSTIWCRLSDDSVPLDAQQLESEFGQGGAGAAASLALTKEASAKGKAGAAASFVSAKRQQNGSIALARFRMPLEAIAEAIVRLDMQLLTLDRLQVRASAPPPSAH